MTKELGELLRRVLGISTCLLSLFWARSVEAQEPPYDPAIDVQLFDLKPGSHSFLAVADAEVTEKKLFSVDFLVTFLTDPLVIYNVDDEEQIVDERTEVVSSVFAGQLVGAYGLTDSLQLGLSIPMVFSINGQGLDPSTGMSGGGIQATGFGDLLVDLKGRLYRKDSLALGFHGGVTLPTSFGAGGNEFLGDDLPSARVGTVAHADFGRIRLGANLGAIFRKPRTIYASEIGQQLTYGAAGRVSVTDRFSVVSELFGRANMTSIQPDASPLEAGLGVRAQVSESFRVLAGGGIGLVSGIGSPGLRFLVSLGFSPDLRDSDGDGRSNMSDRCPLLPEDLDGFEDSDGCPDLDNDGDKRDDNEDKCPNEREDLDGFEDDDGCPEPDNDGDKILDLDDQCPNDAEDGAKPFPKDGCPATKRDSDDDGVSDADDLCPEEFEDDDGFEDWDGCPDLDNDNDGVPDEEDACSLCPEDKDGFEDEDGCPDLDNDNDGVLDANDQCPAEAETLNGNRDEDGCPDGGREIAWLEGQRLMLASPIRFSSRDELRDRRNIKSIAAAMRAQARVAKWRVVVAVKNRGDEDQARQKAQVRADRLREALIAAGLPEHQIEGVGAVSAREVVALAAIEEVTADAEEFVCPASMEAQGRPRPEVPDSGDPAVR